MKNIIIVLLCTSFLYGCKEAGSPEKVVSSQVAEPVSGDIVTMTDQQSKNAKIEVGSPEQRDMHAVLKVTGKIDVPPQNLLSVSIPLGGYVKSMSLVSGQKVRKGDVLAVLEDPQYVQLQQDYLTAKARLVYSAGEYERQKQLNVNKAVSDKVFQQATTDYETQRILLRSIGEKLQLIGINPDKLSESNISRSIKVYSAISGYVSSINVNSGKYVNPTDVLFEIVNPDHLHLALTIFENDLKLLKIGQKVVCYGNGDKDTRYSAVINIINPGVNSDRASEVHCHFVNNGLDLRPGMFMNAEIELNNANTICLPTDAIVKWENKDYVFSEIANNTYKMIPVKVGAPSEGFVPVLSELSGTKIVIHNAYALLMKMKNTSE